MVRQNRAAMTVEKLRQHIFPRVFLEFYVLRRARKKFAILHSLLFFPLKVIGEVPVASL